MKGLLYNLFWFGGLITLAALAAYIFLPMIHIFMSYVNQIMAVFPF